MSFALGPGERVYDRDDLAFAEDLARRASLGIENARLYRQAQESNRSKDDFLAALSHELRTPLNAIMGWASILREAPEQFQRGLDVIHRNAKVQAGLVDDLLDASRIASGKMPLDLANTPLRADHPGRDRDGGAERLGCRRGHRVRAMHGRRASRLGRLGPAAAGVLEHPEQRGEVHRARWPRARLRSHSTADQVVVTVVGHRHRHPPRGRCPPSSIGSSRRTRRRRAAIRGWASA